MRDVGQAHDDDIPREMSSRHATLVPAKCIIINSKTGETFILQAANAETCRNWVTYIMQLALYKPPQPAQEAARLDNTCESTGGRRMPKLIRSMSDQVNVNCIAAMKEGSLYNWYSEYEMQMRKVYYDQSTDAICCCRPDQKPTEVQAQPIIKIVDIKKQKGITIGKKDPIFQSGIGTNAKDESSFSIYTNDAAFHMDAHSGPVAAQWLTGLQYLVKQRGLIKRPSFEQPSLCTLAEIPLVPRALTKRPSLEPSLCTPSEVPLVPRAGAILVDLTKDVLQFKMHRLAAGHKTEAHHITIWVEEDFMTGSGYNLQCANVTAGIRKPERTWNIQDIVDVRTDDYPGVIVPALGACFLTLVFKNEELLILESPTVEMRDACWAGLTLFKTQAVNVVQSFTAKISCLQKGDVFTKHDLGRPVSQMFVFLDVSNLQDACLYWSEPSRAHVMQPSNCIHMMDVTEIHCFFENINVPDSVCISIHTENFVLNLQAKTPELRDKWNEAIHSLMIKMGKMPESSGQEQGFNEDDDDPIIIPQSSESCNLNERVMSNLSVNLKPPAALHRAETRYLGGRKDWNVKLEKEDPEEVYELGRIVGTGAFGQVYKATNKSTGQLVALKKMLEGCSEVEEMRSEIQLLTTLKDVDNIVMLKGVYEKNDCIWIAMEYCEGGALKDIMKACKLTYTEPQVAAIMKMCAQGLRALHSKNIIHRDLKGANILITADGTVKLGDFGVSSQLACTIAKASTRVGTPCFMAPEIIKGEQYTVLADIWSLGITAMELAVGHTPYHDLHPMQVVFKIPVLPAPMLPKEGKWSKDFKSFVEACCQKDPRKRPKSAVLLKSAFLMKAPGKEVLLPAIQQYRDAMDKKR